MLKLACCCFFSFVGIYHLGTMKDSSYYTNWINIHIPVDLLIDLPKWPQHYLCNVLSNFQDRLRRKVTRRWASGWLIKLETSHEQVTDLSLRSPPSCRVRASPSVEGSITFTAHSRATSQSLTTWRVWRLRRRSTRSNGFLSRTQPTSCYPPTVSQIISFVCVWRRYCVIH